MRRLLVALLLLASGCSLPLPEGVREHRGVAVGENAPGDIQVMPPGPRKGASAEEVVRGFLGAESSPEGAHAVARRFLAKNSQWSDNQVRVYDPASLRLTAVAVGEVEVTFTELGRIDPDGRYTALPRTPVTETYVLVQDSQGEWRISGPPPGLRLTPADRERSFPARLLYFVRRSGTTFRVVPDQVLLPGGDAAVSTVLERLLRGPSVGLAGSVATAFPRGTKLQSVVHASGTYDVTLSAHARRADEIQRQQLSAQLVWTVRAVDPRMRALRITVDGKPLDVPGEGAVQRHDDWDAFGPDALTPGPTYFIAAGRLRRLDAGRVGGFQGVAGSLPVDDLAVTPDRTRMAMLQRGAGGVVTVRVGELAGRSFPVVLKAQGLRSPTWGTGERGLWLLDGAGRVMVVIDARRRVVVPVPSLPAPVTALAVSRDGSRAALVSQGTLFVGRVAGAGRGLGIYDVRRVTADLTSVTSVAWRDSTTLIALGSVSQAFVPVVVSVDGSSLRPLPVAGLPSRPEQLAASALGTVVTGSGRLHVLGALGFRQGPVGTSPVHPG